MRTVYSRLNAVNSRRHPTALDRYRTDNCGRSTHIEADLHGYTFHKFAFSKVRNPHFTIYSIRT